MHLPWGAGAAKMVGTATVFANFGFLGCGWLGFDASASSAAAVLRPLLVLVVAGRSIGKAVACLPMAGSCLAWSLLTAACAAAASVPV